MDYVSPGGEKAGLQCKVSVPLQVRALLLSRLAVGNDGCGGRKGRIVLWQQGTISLASNRASCS